MQVVKAGQRPFLVSLTTVLLHEAPGIGHLLCNASAGFGMSCKATVHSSHDFQGLAVSCCHTITSCNWGQGWCCKVGIF